MPLTDLTLDELRAYRPQVAEPADFDAFWDRTLTEARAVGPELLVERVDGPLTGIDVYDVTFPGHGGDPIRGWLTCPRGAAGPLPTIVEYVGYGGGRGLPEEHLQWATAGYVHLLMDTRGQGSQWGHGGDTADPAGSDPAVPGVMTRGILDPEAYYYRRVFTDAVRAIDAVRTLPFVDPTRISVTGGSQGGGISLAVAGLVPDLYAVMPDVPYLCAFRRAVDVAALAPFTEITRYLAVHRDVEEQVFTTLSYFDGVNFAKRATAPGLFSVALMDDIVPPSTVFAAFHAYAAHADIEVYPFNGHEGGQLHQWRKQVAWLAAGR
ncbi:MAG: acetylxylan esterase [Cellulomonadaceae bacterium]|nr:acetylxylan esterase [Cellulomonadaceae bacterium]